MKKVLLMLFFVSALNGLMAQKPMGTNPNQKNLPTKLEVIAPADLHITGTGLISAIGGEATVWDVKLIISVKNSGALLAPATKLKVFAQNASNNANPWKPFVMVAFPSVAPGATVTKEIRVYDTDRVMNKIPRMNLKLKADGENKVSESNENNNESSIILVSPTQ
jgi:hypothetical protein